MDAREFLRLEQVGDANHWRMPVTPDVSTPGKFLFGGCGLGAGLVALESATGRPTVWATVQYLSYAPIGSSVDYEVTLGAAGRNVSQARAVARVDGREILTVNAALGTGHQEANEVFVQAPSVPPPGECRVRKLPAIFADSISDRIDVRVAKGRVFEDLDGSPGDPHTALWARVPGHLDPAAATLAIFGDYVSGCVSQPLGRRTMGRSLDNTLRVVELGPTEWVLCDIRIHAAVNGYAQGTAFLWSQDGKLLATASQSMSIKFWPAGESFRSPMPGAPSPERA